MEFERPRSSFVEVFEKIKRERNKNITEDWEALLAKQRNSNCSTKSFQQDKHNRTRFKFYQTCFKRIEDLRTPDQTVSLKPGVYTISKAPKASQVWMDFSTAAWKSGIRKSEAWFDPALHVLEVETIKQTQKKNDSRTSSDQHHDLSSLTRSLKLQMRKEDLCRQKCFCHKCAHQACAGVGCQSCKHFPICIAEKKNWKRCQIQTGPHRLGPRCRTYEKIHKKGNLLTLKQAEKIRKKNKENMIEVPCICPSLEPLCLRHGHLCLTDELEKLQMERTEKMFQMQAVIRIQRWYRFCKAQMNLKAAIRIQRWYMLCKAQKNLKLEVGKDQKESTEYLEDFEENKQEDLDKPKVQSNAVAVDAKPRDEYDEDFEENDEDILAKALENPTPLKQEKEDVPSQQDENVAQPNVELKSAAEPMALPKPSTDDADALLNCDMDAPLTAAIPASKMALSAAPVDDADALLNWDMDAPPSAIIPEGTANQEMLAEDPATNVPTLTEPKENTEEDSEVAALLQFDIDGPTKIEPKENAGVEVDEVAALLNWDIGGPAQEVEVD